MEEMTRNELYLLLNKVSLSDEREAFFELIIQSDDFERRGSWRKICIFGVDLFTILLFLLMHLMHLDARIDEIVSKHMHVMTIGKLRQRSFVPNILQKLVQNCLLLFFRNLIIISLTLAVFLILLSLIRVILRRLLDSHPNSISFIAQQKHDAFLHQLSIFSFSFICQLLAEEGRNEGKVVQRLSGPEMRLWLAVQKLKGKHLGSPAFVRRVERLPVAHISKHILQLLHILMVPNNSMLFEFLFLLYLFLIVVPIPKVVIAPDMRKDGLNNSTKGAFVLVVDGKLHEVILEMVIF
jgi:hypothetical protein